MTFQELPSLLGQRVSRDIERVLDLVVGRGSSRVIPTQATFLFPFFSVFRVIPYFRTYSVQTPRRTFGPPSHGEGFYPLCRPDSLPRRNPTGKGVPCFGSNLVKRDRSRDDTTSSTLSFRDLLHPHPIFYPPPRQSLTRDKVKRRFNDSVEPSQWTGP